MSGLIRTYAVYAISRSVCRSIAEFYLTARHTQDQWLKDQLLPLVRLIGSLNRRMGALRAIAGHRGFGCIIALTAIVTEGRILCFIPALYAFSVFRCVTATLATFFVGRDAENDEAEVAAARYIEALRQEIIGLRADIQALSAQNPEQEKKPS